MSEETELIEWFAMRLFHQNSGWPERWSWYSDLTEIMREGYRRKARETISAIDNERGLINESI